MKAAAEAGDPEAQFLYGKELTEAGESDVNESARFPGPFAKFSATPMAVSAKTPTAGEHTDEVLAQDLKLSTSAIRRLRDSGAVR